MCLVGFDHYDLFLFQADARALEKVTLDASRALAMPGVVTVLTGAEVKELTDPSSGTAHEVARRLKEDGVDVVLFIPG